MIIDSIHSHCIFSHLRRDAFAMNKFHTDMLLHNTVGYPYNKRNMPSNNTDARGIFLYFAYTNLSCICVSSSEQLDHRIVDSTIHFVRSPSDFFQILTRYSPSSRCTTSKARPLSDVVVFQLFLRYGCCER